VVDECGRAGNPENTLRYSLGVFSHRIVGRSVGAVNVPSTILALLEPEPSHGYELKHEYDRYFAVSGRPLSFGHLYGTLSRLERDGQISVLGAEPGEGPDRKRYVITPAGVTQLEQWLAEPERPEPMLQATLYVKVVLALLSDRPAAEHLEAQRQAHLARMHELTAMRKAGPLDRTLLADYGLFHLEADLRWIDVTLARLDQLRGEIAR
jgi:DNA-binding PadR family transcriptional regulator